MSEEIVKIENCFKIYRDPTSRVETVALKDVSFSIYKGEILTISGPSGSGKTSLLNIIGGLDVPNAGNVIHHNMKNAKGNTINLPAISAEERDLFRTQNIGYLQQKPILLPHLSAIENIELPLLAKGIVKPRELALEWIVKLGLNKIAHSKPIQLSGGERQRVSLASSLAIHPSILLLDEPTSETDSKTSNTIIEMLKQLNKELGITMVIVTHDLNLAKEGDRSFILEDGRISKRKLFKDKIDFKLQKDKWDRIRLPPEVLETLSNPTLILFEPRERSYRLLNAEFLDQESYKEEKDLVRGIDRLGMVVLPDILKEASETYIQIRNGNTFLNIEEGKP